MDSQTKTIVSPLPGVFYRKPSPDSAEYVQEGDCVEPDQTICVVEVMKNFYEVKAEFSGTVGRFLIQDGDMIDVGQEIVQIVSGN